ncbi:MAG: hypothetical protein WCF39_13675 [Pseudolabrys sp.]
MDDARNHDTAGIGERFEPRRHIDAIAEDIAAVDDDIAHVNANAELNALVGWHIGVALGHATLNIDGAAHGIDNADKFHQNPVACRLDDAAAMLRDLRVDELLAVNFEGVKRALIVGTHETAVASNIPGKDRGKSALDAIVNHPELPVTI